MNVTSTVKYVGVNDHDLDLFEGQYTVPNGMAYNSYLIMDERTAVMDSVDGHFTKVWLDNIRGELDGRGPDYLIVQHMEPDHSGSIVAFMAAFPDAIIVSSAKAFTMLKNFYDTDFAHRRVVVGEGDTLSLGGRTLTFSTAPMVHWPEVIVTYDDREKILFSADAFGKFGALDTEEDWVAEARRYYIGIVGKYGVPVQALLKKTAGLDIRTICPLHGPVLTENLGYYLDLYHTWSTYTPEEEGILIAYTSVYGNTKKAVELLAEQLRQAGTLPVVVRDLARCDMAEAVADAFRYSRLVLATTTYNGDIFPYMREFIEQLTERNFSGRTVALIENGSWAPNAARVMKKLLERSRDIRYTAASVTLLSALNIESRAQISALAEELLGSSTADAPDEPAAKKKFVCRICGYVHEGESLPDDFTCPLCGRGPEEFEAAE